MKNIYFSIIKKDGSLELKRKFPIKHRSQLAMIRSAFCPIMSFRQGACIGKYLNILFINKDSLFYLLKLSKTMSIFLDYYYYFFLKQQLLNFLDLVDH